MAGNDSSIKVGSPGGSPMESTPLKEEVMAFLNRLEAPSEFILEGDGDFTKEDRNSSPGLLRNSEPHLAKPSKWRDEFVEAEKKVIPLDSFLKKDDPKPTPSKKEGPPHEPNPFLMDSFLVEMVHNIKNALASVYHATVLTMDKYDDLEIRRRSHTQVKEEIKRIDSVLNTLLNFINVNTPHSKTSGLYVILEEILEASEKQLQQKDMKIYKKYENDLPDTFIHPEQVRFILHSTLQYAILSTPPGEVIGFLMKSSDSHNGTGAETPSSENNRRYIEVMIGFDGDGKSGAPGDENQGMADLILRLAKDILERNHGMMTETRKRSETILTLRFPVERRKGVYYEPIAL